jgi:RNA polymerase sigma-70 factor (sigma-E family)
VAAYEESFAALYQAAYRVAYRVLGDREEAQDVAQEVLARAFLRWRRIGGYPEAWVARVAGNLAIDRWRRRVRAPELLPPDAVADGRVAERVDLVRALRALPRRQREVVVLRYLADLPEAAVADHLGCSVGSVKTHASRGLAQLRTRLDAPVGG